MYVAMQSQSINIQLQPLVTKAIGHAVTTVLGQMVIGHRVIPLLIGLNDKNLSLLLLFFALVTITRSVRLLLERLI